jgi:hypothetical protein
MDNKPNLPQFVIEKAAYQAFQKRFADGQYAGQRYGQAFYNEFRLHLMSDQAVVGALYELNGITARTFIASIFTFN